MYQCNGWGSGYYSKEGATETSLGKAVTPAPKNTPAVAWEKLSAEAGQDIVEKDLDWSDYSPEIGSVWEDKPGMIWFTISAASIGYPKNIDGYKIYINNFDFDMGSPRGMIDGEPETWKFGTGSIPKDNCPAVVDETDSVIIIK